MADKSVPENWSATDTLSKTIEGECTTMDTERSSTQSQNRVALKAGGSVPLKQNDLRF